MNAVIKTLSVSTYLVPFYLLSSPAYAYLGPGMGGGVFAATIGFFAAVVIGLSAIIYFPIKRALKKRKEKRTTLKELDNESK